MTDEPIGRIQKCQILDEKYQNQSEIKGVLPG
jgi:hypothetical protein